MQTAIYAGAPANNGCHVANVGARTGKSIRDADLD